MTSTTFSFDSHRHSKVCSKELDLKPINDLNHKKLSSKNRFHAANNTSNRGNLNLERATAGDRDSNYSTLESALSSNNSRYNTVDSSYSNSSGYSTLDLKWKEPSKTQKEAELIKQKDTDSYSSHSQAAIVESYPVSKSFLAADPNANQLKFVDELDDSDTATETETDTEVDMSYVPDYIRPVAAGPVSVMSLTSTTTSFTTTRPTLSSTLTSPSVSLSSSAMTSPTGSVVDDAFGISPKATNHRKYERSSSTYVGYREDYIRKQKEKLCGRKSLDERLKSLESGASVKLQVCKGSRNRQRTSAEKEMVSSNRFYQSSVTGLRSRNSAQKLVENDKKQNLVNLEETPTISPPDIIESHQPPANITRISSQESGDDMTHNEKFASSEGREQMELDSFNILPKSLTCVNPAPINPSSTTSECSTPHIAGIKSNATSPQVSRKLSGGRDTNGEIPYLEKPEFESAYVTPDVSFVDEELPQSPKSPKIKELSKLSWREPSQEALNRLNFDSSEKPRQTADEMAYAVDVDSVEMVKDLQDTAPEADRGKSGARQMPIQPPTIDVTVDDVSVLSAVELRSSRVERIDTNKATTDREKRNARMFALSSTDESEGDSLLASINTSVQNKPVHVAPVKFVPSVLRRNQLLATKDEKDESNMLSSTSPETDVKFTSGGMKKSSSAALPAEHSRKSSRPPKRSNSKRSARSKSSHDRPSSRESKHTRTLSSGSQSPVLVTTSSSAEMFYDRPKEPLFRKEKTNKNSMQTRHGAEYVELSVAQRNTARKLNNFPTVSSPRQQAVAQAVKFGFSKNEGIIPYIDDSVTHPLQKVSHIDVAKEDDHPNDPGIEEVGQATVKSIFPLSSRGRSSKRRTGVFGRRSYTESLESSDDVTPTAGSEGSVYDIARAEAENEGFVPFGKYGRSTSADSILSTTEAPAKAFLRKRNRANSADRNSVEGVNRRSYKIATTTSTDTALTRTPSHKRQPSFRKLKNFFVENMTEPYNDAPRKTSGGRSVEPALSLNEYDGSVIREGFLNFKVATIENGKRTSSQKSWKFVWAVLKEQSLYLCKDWSRNKQDSFTGSPSAGTVGVPIPGSGQTPSQLVLEEEKPLNIRGSLVSIAYNYVKKKNVFKVTTSSGSEYLFQADDREDMLAWINSIQVSGNHDNEDGEVRINEDLILRKTNQIESGPKSDKRSTRKSRSPKPVRRTTVQVKDFDGSRRFKWRGSVNRIVKKFGQGQTLMQGSTFDVLLEDCPPSLNNDLVPFVVELCCRIVEERGLSFTGIYRVPGNSGTLVALQEELNQRGADEVDLENDERFRELNVVSSLLKSFFRKLPDPLFTNELYDNFITMNRKKDSEERLKGLRRLIHMLPAPHYETLKFLVAHLRKVAENSEVNKMEIRNLAIVFGPTLVRSSTSDNMATMVTDMSDQCRIVESVLQHAVWFFTDDETQGMEDNLLSVPVENPHEPVPNIDHLLANVGRTTGDVSDSTSESSRSKISCNSEKESFSRDVMDIIFGKKRMNTPHRGTKEQPEESSDDEYGFKEAERNQARAALQRPKTPPHAPPATSATNSKYQVAKAAASDIRASFQKQGRQHLPSDIHARLYDFYVENMERIARSDVTQPLSYFSSSSADTSPQATPRTTFGSSQHAPSRSYPVQGRRSSDGKPYSASAQPFASTDNKGESDPFPPFKHKPSPYQSKSANLQPFTSSSSCLPKDNGRLPKPVFNPPTVTISKADFHEDSDSDTSIYVGDTLEEKLKNLTNLNKKLDRRPSRRQDDSSYGILFKMAPPVESARPMTKKIKTAPSRQAGETITNDNIHMYSTKKTTRELYQERKLKRQKQREIVKASRASRKAADVSRCASDENIFNRCDPKRQIIRQPSQDDSAADKKRRPRQSKEKVQRRHTLGGSDFPSQRFWENSESASQNLPQNTLGSAMSRLRPSLGASAPSLVHKPNDVRTGKGSARGCPEKSRKTESYL